MLCETLTKDPNMYIIKVSDEEGKVEKSEKVFKK